MPRDVLTISNFLFRTPLTENQFGAGETSDGKMNNLNAQRAFGKVKIYERFTRRTDGYYYYVGRRINRDFHDVVRFTRSRGGGVGGGDKWTTAVECHVPLATIIRKSNRPTAIGRHSLSAGRVTAGGPLMRLRLPSTTQRRISNTSSSRVYTLSAETITGTRKRMPLFTVRLSDRRRAHDRPRGPGVWGWAVILMLPLKLNWTLTESSKHKRHQRCIVRLLN